MVSSAPAVFEADGELAIGHSSHFKVELLVDSSVVRIGISSLTLDGDNWKLVSMWVGGNPPTFNELVILKAKLESWHIERLFEQLLREMQNKTPLRLGGLRSTTG